MEKNKLQTKPITTIVIKIAELICGVWWYTRCKLWRKVNDFDYHIYDLRSEYPNDLVYKIEVGKQPYISKTLINEDDYEKTSSIKIGDCCITYTFNKIRRAGLIETTEVIPLWKDFDPYKHEVETIISRTKLSHNKPNKLKVIKINRKDKRDVQLYNK